MIAVHRPGLAKTLRAIAEDGRDGFYRGKTAAAIAAAHRGLVTEEDVAASRSDWVDPISLRGARADRVDGSPELAGVPRPRWSLDAGAGWAPRGTSTTPATGTLRSRRTGRRRGTATTSLQTRDGPGRSGTNCSTRTAGRSAGGDRLRLMADWPSTPGRAVGHGLPVRRGPSRHRCLLHPVQLHGDRFGHRRRRGGVLPPQPGRRIRSPARVAQRTWPPACGHSTRCRPPSGPIPRGISPWSSGRGVATINRSC